MARRERRRTELQQERHCTIAHIRHVERAWVLPHPDWNEPNMAPMGRDENIERIAVAEAIHYEEARGWEVTSVEKEDKGFDLISLNPRHAAEAMHRFGAQKNRYFFQLERPDYKDKSGKSWDVEIEDLLPWPLLAAFIAQYPEAVEERFARGGVQKVVILGRRWNEMDKSLTTR